MRDFWGKIKAYLRKSASVEVKIGQMTVTRLTIFGIAAAIVVFGLVFLLYMVYGNKEVRLNLERTDMEPGHAYRINDGVVFYDTSSSYISLKPAESARVNTSNALVTADGYDISSTTKVVFLGSSAQIIGPEHEQDEFVLEGGGRILSARAGRRHAALLYRNQYGDSRISIMNSTTKDPQVDATVPITGGEVVAFGFLQLNDNTEYLWVSTMDINQFSEESMVRVYNCDNNGALIFYSTSFYNQTIKNALLTPRCLYLIGSQDIIRYDRTDDGFSSERARVSIYGSTVLDCRQSADSESAYFITIPVTAETEKTHICRLLTVSQSDEEWATVLQQFMSSPIVGAFLREDKVCVVTEKTYEEYSYAGKQSLSLEFEETPDKVVKYADGFFLATPTACYRVTVE